MAVSKKTQYKYMGTHRPEFTGTVKSFFNTDLTDEKVKSLEEKGWEKVEKKKPVKKEEG